MIWTAAHWLASAALLAGLWYLVALALGWRAGRDGKERRHGE